MSDSLVAEIDRLTVRFGRTTAVQDLSFTVPAGAVVAFLGPNGAGKSTTIRALLGLLTPRGGGCRVFGLDSRRRGPRIRARTGYVPEERHFYDWMTVGELGWFAAGFYPTWKEEKFSEMIKGWRIDPAGKVGALSKGMRAKLALALALAHEPRFLVLDEPTGGLDVAIRREFLESLVEFSAAGGTVLIASHLVAEVERVASEVVLIDQSRLVVKDSLEGLKEKTREIVLSFAEAPPAVDHPAVLKQVAHQRSVVLRVRDYSEELTGELRQRYQPRSLETKPLALEEIFLAYQPGGNGAGA